LDKKPSEDIEFGLGILEGLKSLTKKYSASGMPLLAKCLKDGSKLILIPAGEFTMGSPEGKGYKDEHPQHKIYLDAYYIGKYEVTNEQFARFVRETDYRAYAERKSNIWKVDLWNTYYNSGTADHPVICITWEDAVAYCKWAGLRLPTEAEWEKAVRGTDGRKYPWGKEWDKKRCNWWKGPNLSGMADLNNSRGTLPVGSFPGGTSPYGCMDMLGNVWEWCGDWYGENYYKNSLQSNPEGPESDSYRVVRGGSWGTNYPVRLRCAYRGGDYPVIGGLNCGFRVARSMR